MIQGESLVGNRQWWITKPYEWWSLFLAKLLFFFVFISVPLFHVQLFLLNKFGFPVLGNLRHLFSMQFALFLDLFVLAANLASFTKNIGQALLTVGGIIAAVVGVAWLMTMFPNSDEVKSPPVVVARLQDCLVWGALLTVSIFQFAMRKRWRSLGLLAGALALSALLGVVVPSATSTETE